MSSSQFDYFNVLNTHLLRLLPADARLIVEIGCAGGLLGQEYKRIYPHARYIGIELNADAAAQAARHLDDVIVGHVEHLADSAIPIKSGTVDALVYGDVLEHLVDPWSVLRRHATWLTPGGLVLACIPNIAHWSAMVHLLMGEWPHLEQGLFDRTHLRFFTQSSIRELFAQANLDILDMHTRNNTTPESQPREAEFLRLFLPFVKQLGLLEKPFADRSLAFQYVVRASKRPGY